MQIAGTSPNQTIAHRRKNPYTGYIRLSPPLPTAAHRSTSPTATTTHGSRRLRLTTGWGPTTVSLGRRRPSRPKVGKPPMPRRRPGRRRQHACDGPQPSPPRRRNHSPAQLPPLRGSNGRCGIPLAHSDAAPASPRSFADAKSRPASLFTRMRYPLEMDAAGLGGFFWTYSALRLGYGRRWRWSKQENIKRK